MSDRPKNFLCVSTYFKGGDFIKACKEAGNKVYLLTTRKLEHEAWPYSCIEDSFYLEDDIDGMWNMKQIINALAFQMRNVAFDKFIALDDFDVEKVAELREYFQIPGMGETTAHYFRDKLAMRMKAVEAGIAIPDFTSLFNDEEINDFTSRVEPPWMLKPRFEASAVGITKLNNSEELWKMIDQLGDLRHKYLLEKFASGDVYHVDALSVEGDVVFSRVSKYLDTPFEVAHGGGIFKSMTIKFGSEDDIKLRQMNRNVLQGFGMQYSASHTEFIKSHENGKFYFIETSSRVGGAHLAEMVEASSGINLWAEWARLETAVAHHRKYQLPEPGSDYAGIVVSLSRYQHPDDSSFKDPEICWRLVKDWHIGFIVKSKSPERIKELLEDYTKRIGAEFHASLPASEKLHN